MTDAKYTDELATIQAITAADHNATAFYRALGEVLVEMASDIAALDLVGGDASAANQLLAHTKLDTLHTDLSPASTGAAVAVALTTSSTTLKAANASRIGLIVYNPLSVTVYVRFENADAAVVQTFWVRPGETYEMPLRYYTGIITAATASSSGSVFVTELT